ncbi:MAG: mechanosensitive ion channel family protein [Acidobacteria bacterium]|nr:mechanosensitive ion channel family protein [Acidobacteriota bacterium]
MRDLRLLLPLVLLSSALVLGVGAPARAQAPPAAGAEAAAASAPDQTSAPAEAEGPEVAEDSPRASLQAYLELSRQGEWEKAARYLRVPEERKAEAPLLAERLKAVLNTYVWFDHEQISPRSEGDLNDGLSRNVEKVAKIPVGNERTEPVYMVRRPDPDNEGEYYWAFSRGTVGRIDGWYDQLPDRWIREWLIGAGLEPLLRKGPFGLLWWQWLAMPLLALLAWALGRALGRVTRAILRRVFARTRTQWDDRLLGRVGPPLTLAWGLVIFYAALPKLGLTAQADSILRGLLAAGAAAVFFWALWRSLDVLADFVTTRPWAEESPSTRNLLTIGANLAKGVVAGLGVVAVLSAIGYPVTTLLAGLGIGGLAFAFGAQKTVENLFGSISLAVDQPFRVGDFVKVEDFVGTVEEIGLRSTRFRTLDRTVISIPNGQLSDQRLETFAARDRMRLATTIGLEYGTTHAQMLQVIEGFERVLRDHEKIWPDAMVVKFKEFGASSLDIEIMAWFQVPTWGDFQQCRQEVLLGFIKVVEDAGTAFAFPTQTLHVFNEKASPSVNEPTPPPPAPSSPPPDTAKPEDLPVSDGD